MEKNTVFAALPKQCHLAAQVQIDDHLMHRGIPQEYITAQLSRELGRHLEQKSSTFIKREDRSVRYPGYAFAGCGATVYTAEVFVFSEEELKAFAKRMHQEGAQSVRSTMIQTEVQLKVGSVKSKLKESLTAHIDKALA